MIDVIPFSIYNVVGENWFSAEEAI